MEKVTLDFILSVWRRKFKPGEIELLSLQIKALIYNEKKPYIDIVYRLLEDGEDNRLSETMKREASELLEIEYKFNPENR